MGCTIYVEHSYITIRYAFAGVLHKTMMLYGELYIELGIGVYNCLHACRLMVVIAILHDTNCKTLTNAPQSNSDAAITCSLLIIQ